METISYGLGGIAGPALAGLLVGLFGAPWVLAIDAATYAVFVACLALIRTPSRAGSEAADADGAAGGRRGAGLGPAFRFIRRTPAVLFITFMFMSFNVGEGMLLVLLPLYARDALGGDASTYGLLVSSFTGGMLIGALAVGAIDWRWPLGRSIAAAQLLAGLVLLGLVARPGLAGTVAVLALAGLCASPLTIWAQTIRMRLIPPDMRGRVFGLLRTLMQSTPPAGGIVGGALIGAVGMPVVAAVVAGLAIVPGVRGLWAGSLGPGADPTAASGRATRLPAGIDSDPNRG
jgi:MFS family permease